MHISFINLYDFFFCSSMTSISTLYTKLLPKHPDILGTKDQAFGHKSNFLNYLVGAINAKTVAAIGMVLPGIFWSSTCVDQRSILIWLENRLPLSEILATSSASFP